MFRENSDSVPAIVHHYRSVPSKHHMHNSHLPISWKLHPSQQVYFVVPIAHHEPLVSSRREGCMARDEEIHHLEKKSLLPVSKRRTRLRRTVARPSPAPTKNSRRSPLWISSVTTMRRASVAGSSPTRKAAIMRQLLHDKVKPPVDWPLRRRRSQKPPNRNRPRRPRQRRP